MSKQQTENHKNGDDGYPVSQSASGTDRHIEPKRYRIRYSFWLDVLKPDEREIDDYIADLKRGRKFAQTIREGLKLVATLREGRVDLLESLFPFIREHYRKEFEQPRDSDANLEFARIMREHAEIIASLKANPSRAEPSGFEYAEQLAADVNIFAGGSVAVDPGEARDNFASGMGDLFGDDDDDLWD